MLNRETIVWVARHCYPRTPRERKLLSREFRQRIRERLTRDDFIEIVKWKAPRVGKRAESDGSRIEESARKAFGAPSPARAVEILSKDEDHRLAGVQVRMASAILTVLNPERYTVLDMRSFVSLTRYGLERLPA